MTGSAVLLPWIYPASVASVMTSRSLSCGMVIDMSFELKEKPSHSIMVAGSLVLSGASLRPRSLVRSLN